MMKPDQIGPPLIRSDVDIRPALTSGAGLGGTPRAVPSGTGPVHVALLLAGCGSARRYGLLTVVSRSAVTSRSAATSRSVRRVVIRVPPLLVRLDGRRSFVSRPPSGHAAASPSPNLTVHAFHRPPV